MTEPSVELAHPLQKKTLQILASAQTLSGIGDYSTVADGSLLLASITLSEALAGLVASLRTAGAVGASLQATLVITAGADDAALLRSLGDDLKFVTITSDATVVDGAELQVAVAPSTAQKCERCWHYRDDVGHDPAHPGLCGRCTSNLHGAGEVREHA